jgi:hypothetical protein
MQNRSQFALFRFEVKNFLKAKPTQSMRDLSNDGVLNARSSVRVYSRSWS